MIHLNPISFFNSRLSIIQSILLFFCIVNATTAQISIDFSEERGFYTSPISVVISSPEDPNASIRYTINNDKPSPISGTVYTGPITINQTTSIRAVAYGANGNSKVITHTYIFLNDITSSTYMSNHVPNNALLDQSLLSIPTISIVSDDIFGTNHIDLETETSLEMIFPNGDKGFMLHCGIQTWGGSPSNPKKAYRLEFKSQYGDSKLDFDVFNSDDYETHEYKVPPRLEFDKLLLRSGSQDGLNGEFGNETNAQFIRNRVMMDVSMELGFPEAHGRFVHVYVNGDYIGQYHLMERPDGSWFETYYGGNKDDYEVRRGIGNYWDGYNGSNEGPAHNNMTGNINLGSEFQIANTNNYIDLKSAANYLVMMGYLSGFDWGDSKNALCGGHQTPGVTPYKFLLWDVDLGLGQGGKWHPDFSGSVTYFDAPFNNDGPVPNGLVGNAEFNLMMADQLHCACFDDGPLTQNNIDSLYFERASQIDTSIIAEAARWGNYTFTNNGNVNVPNWDKGDWNSELNYMRNIYLPQRVNNLVNLFKNNNVYPSTNGVQYSDNGGLFDNGYQLTLTNPNGGGTIYYTTNGSDPRSHGGGVRNSAQVYSGPITLPFGVYEVKARIRRNGVWSAMCPKKFYIGQEYTNIRINEIHYNPADSVIAGSNVKGKEFEFVELKNRGTTPVDMTDVIFDKGVTIFFPEGLIIPAGGFLILAEDAVRFQQKYGFAPDIIWEGKLDNGGEELRYVGPDKKTIDKVNYDDSFPWTAVPDQGLYSLGCIDINVTNNSPVNWAVQSTYTTPGAENVFGPNVYPDYSGIVINEIHYHPRDSFHIGPDTLVPSKEFEFIEIKNTSNTLKFLIDVEFVEGVNYRFKDNLLLPPNGFVVLAEDSMWFHERYGFAPYDEYSGKLENDSDTIVIYDVFNRVVDSVAYFDSGNWDPLPDFGDYSLALIDPNANHNAASNWSHQCTYVTPDADNTFDDDDDSVCNDADICPNFDDNLIGQPCNDGDICTTGETYDSSCGCSGGVFQDADSDGVCDANDSCPNFDDNLIGQACSDGDPCTVGELYDSNCGCSGGVFLDSDNDGICEANDVCPNFDDNLIGQPCSDGDACTTGETYDSNCGCTGGVFQDADSDGVCDSNDNCANFDDNLIGQSCSDGDPCTTGETYDTSCGCSGGVFQDADSDGVCDVNDVCANFDDNLIGQPCDDGNPCTVGDMYDTSCACVSGTTGDSDNDGVCDALDQCPGANDNLIGQACEDGDICTTGETYDSLCDCSGGVFQDADNDGVCNALDDACTTTNFGDFESGSGIWQSNGGDAALVSSANSPSGNSSFRIRDNSGLASSMSSGALDLSIDDSAVIKFSFQTKLLSIGEDFFLEISADGGASFQLLKTWVRGTDFNNNIIYQEEIPLLDTQVSANTVFRFTCDASINSDEVFIDNIRIETCPGDCESAIYQTTNSIISSSESVINVIESNGLVQSSADIEFVAGNYILMSEGFEVEIGAVYHAYIDDCSN